MLGSSQSIAGPNIALNTIMAEELSKFADVLERVFRYNWMIIPSLLYLLSAIFVIIWGSTEVIWCLPLNKLWRTAIFILWLVIYPALCYAWLAACIYIFLFGITFF